MHDVRSEEMEPTASNIMAIRKATGLPVQQAKQFIADNPPELCRRVLVERRKHGMLYDPTEDDPEIGPTIQEVRAQCEEAAGPWCRGWKRGVETKMKKTLSDKHGIVWFTFVEMNPGTTAD